MPVRRSRSAAAAALLAVALLTAACGLNPATAPPLGSLQVGLGFIPSVQFAPFYLADREGYYREAGLDVTFQNKIDPDLITLVGQGAVDIGLADGTSVIPAVSQGIPVRYVATVYGRFPSIVFAKATSGIDDPADLAGKRIGIPGRYGSSWVMLQAMLRSADLSPDDVVIVDYPDFGQGVAVQQDQVDAATGFVNNEPIQLELSGAQAAVLTVDEFVPLPGPGLITGAATLRDKPDALRAFVAATLRAMDEIAADPEKGLEASIAAVPELGSNRDVQRAILLATIAAWEPVGGGPLGSVDRDAWRESIEFLSELDLVPNPVQAEDLTTLELLPAG